MKVRRIITPGQCQPKVLKHLHSNHMDMNKPRLLIVNYLYWLNMNEDINEAVKRCSTEIKFQQMQ